MNTKRIVFFLLITAISIQLKAQQSVQFTQSPWAAPYYNAGAIGETKNTLCFTLFYRSQFTGFKDDIPSLNGGEPQKVPTGPQNIAVFAEFYSKKAGGIGLNVVSDRIGFYNNIDVQLGYCYKIPIPTGHLSLGFQVNLLDKRLDVAKLRALNPSDPILVGMSDNWMNLDFNLGAFYKGVNWYAGISAINLAQSLVLAGDKNINLLKREFTLSGGYEWFLPNGSLWSIEPNLFIKTNFATAQYDVMLLAKYNNSLLWTGLVYRVQDAVAVVIGAKPFTNHSNNYLKGLEMGFSYDFPTSRMGFVRKPNGGSQTNSFGGFEVMLRYGFGIYKEPVYNGYGNSRYLYRSL